MSDALSAGRTFERAPEVLWRIASDRVLTHRIGAAPTHTAADLCGAVGLVWLALDEPATCEDVTARLADAEVYVHDVQAELDRLLAAGLIVEPGSEDAPSMPGPSIVDVCSISVFDTTVLVRAAEPLVDELRGALTNLGAEANRNETDRGAESVHQLDVRLLGDTWTVRWDGTASYQGPSIDLALYDSLILLNQHASRRATERGWTVLHGGAVALDGRAVAVVGHSGAGKSTLTTALTRRGHPYLADEVVAVREDFTVAPFHRPVGLRSGGAARVGIDVPAGPYGSMMPYHVSGALGGGEPLGLIVVLRRTDEPIDARLTDLDQASALFELANQTLGATGNERAVFWRLDGLVRAVRTVELHYHDVADAASVLEALPAHALACGPG